MTLGHEWTPPGIDAARPSVARVHDALLGGTDNFAVDRAVADRLRQAVPEVVDLVWCNRAFIGRATDYLVREAGVTQFVDLGSGLPTIENTHEVAQWADPAARVVYVDIDPMVEAQARRILSENGRAVVVTADVRDLDAVLGHPDVVRLIDFSRPVAVLMVGLLHLFHDDTDPWSLVAGYMRPLAPGSHLVASNFFASPNPQAKALEAMLHATMGTGYFRSRPAIARFFAGLELADPGLVAFPEWRPDTPPGATLAPWEEILLGGVARKP